MENLGIIEDQRPQVKKNLDYKHFDMHPAGSIVLNWIEKDPKDWKKYTPREQDGSLSCVAQSCAKGIEILENKVMSAHPIYRSRFNFPSGGMYPQNAGEICRNLGTTTEAKDPSQNQNEATINRDITVYTPDKIGGYFFVDPKDIIEIAEAIELNKHCFLLIRCNKNEWKAIPKYEGDVVNFHHELTAVDYFLYKGEQKILIEDSTGHYSSFDKNGQRLLGEDFLKARCDNAMYFTPLPPKPILVFKRNLKIGCVGDDVKQLQLRLNIGADGLFGKKTKKAVIDFQIQNVLKPDGIVGPITLKVLNIT